VAVDRRGNVVAGGNTINTGSGIDFTGAKFNRNGRPLGKWTLNGTASDFDSTSAVAVDRQGNGDPRAGGAPVAEPRPQPCEERAAVSYKL
jgi:hypothetical protein